MNRHALHIRRLCAQLRRLLGRSFWEIIGLVGVRKGDIYRLFGLGKLTPQQRQSLLLMRHDNALSGTPFKASDFWCDINKSFGAWLEVEGILDVESQTFNRYFSGHIPSRVLYQASWLLYQKVKARDRLNLLGKIPASAKKDSGLGYLFDGNYVSWDLLISLDTLYSIAEVDDTILSNAVTVLDLGPGWGRMGYLLRLANPRIAYIACDLPEGLLISSSYLPRLLPNTRAFYYSDNRAVKVFTKELLLSEAGIRFCGPQDILRFADKSLDYLINVASFQEMTREQVNQYFDIIDHKVSGILYIQEYYDGSKMGHTDREISGLQYYPFRQHWKRLYVRNVSFSDQYFEAAVAIRPRLPV